jgi:hypothetical protein
MAGAFPQWGQMAAEAGLIQWHDRHDQVSPSGDGRPCSGAVVGHGGGGGGAGEPTVAPTGCISLGTARPSRGQKRDPSGRRLPHSMQNTIFTFSADLWIRGLLGTLGHRLERVVRFGHVTPIL